MFMDVQLAGWVQWAILIGLGVLAVWTFIVLIVIYQTAVEVSDFIAKERERLGYGSRSTSKPIERWDAAGDE